MQCTIIGKQKDTVERARYVRQYKLNYVFSVGLRGGKKHLFPYTALTEWFIQP
jgi:hypothetical protein